MSRDVELFKEDVSELLRAVNIERFPCDFVNVRGELFKTISEFDAIRLKLTHIDAHALQFHVSQYAHKWHFNFFEQLCGDDTLHLRYEALSELPGDIHVLTSVISDRGSVKVCHGPLIFPRFTDEISDGDGRVAQFDFRQTIQLVGALRLDEIMCNHRIEQSI